VRYPLNFRPLMFLRHEWGIARSEGQPSAVVLHLPVAREEERLDSHDKQASSCRMVKSRKLGKGGVGRQHNIAENKADTSVACLEFAKGVVSPVAVDIYIF
jgi:hypothetical protein